MIYKVQRPDGTIMELEGPEGASDDEILHQAQTLSAQQPQNAQQAPQAAPQGAPALGWGDVPMEALKNAPKSAARLAGGIYDAVTSPLETAKGLSTLAAGAGRAGLRALIPGLEAPGNEDTRKQDEMAAGALQALKDRYGGEEQLKKTLATDPVGAAADLSTLFTGGAGISPKLATAAKWTDPVRGMTALGSKALGAGAEGVKQVLGKTTGVGPEALGIAYQAGEEGGDAGKAYRAAVTGKLDGASVVEDARAAVGVLYNNASDAYNAEKAKWAGQTGQLDLAPIEAAYQNLVAGTQTGKGFSKLGKSDQKVLGQIGTKIEEFKALHPNPTVADLDALKQAVSNIVPKSPMHTQQSRMLGNMRNTIKAEIGRQAPQYEAAMRGYSNAMDELGEIQRTLSLGDKATTDTALRKLTSLTRNNVNTAYGHRLKLAQDLEEASGKQLLPAMAGLANSEWLPRGIQGATIAPASVMAGMAIHPGWFAPLAAESPRLVGGAYHNAGRLAGMPGRAMDFAAQSPALARAGRAVADRMPSRSAISRGAVVTGSVEDLLAESEALAELKRQRR